MGVYVNDVEEGSCAEAAGIRRGDIITKIDDTEITGVSQLTSVKNSYRAGDTVKVEVYRSGESITLTLTFDEQQNSAQTSGGQGDQNVYKDPAPRQTSSGGYYDPYGGNGGYYDPFSEFPWSYFFR